MIKNIVKNLSYLDLSKKKENIPLNQSEQKIETVSSPPRPLLSVVVPCYMVEKYLVSTLDSIARQRGMNLEIIVIDDGSPDNSGEIAEAYARRDARVKVHHKVNGGLGAARNTGIALAAGQYITFADSDDTIPQGSYEAMVSQLEKTGSDFVIGTMERRLGNRTWIPDWAKHVHLEDREGCRLEDDLEVLKDVFACNKVFRRSFWDANVELFPENIRYEDQEATAKAFTRSAAFDILKRVVYTWVIREDGSSITQQKARIEDLSDRLKVMDNVSAVLRENSTPEVHTNWAIKSIGFDLKPYYDQVSRTDEDYWSLLSSGVKRLAGFLNEGDWTEIPFWERVLAGSVAEGCANDVALIQASKQEFASGYEVVAVPSGQLVCKADFLEELSFDFPISRLKPSESSLRLRTELHDLTWLTESSVEITGSARISGIGSNNFPYSITLLIENKNNIEYPIRIDGKIVESSLPDISLNDAYNTYNETFFSAIFDLSELSGIQRHRESDVKWRINVEASAAGLTKQGSFDSISVLGRAGTFELGKLYENERYSFAFDENAGLSVNVPLGKPIARSISISGRRVLVDVDRNSFENIDRLILRSKHHRDIVFRPIENSESGLIFEFDLPLLNETDSNEVLTELRVGNKSQSYLIQFGDSSIVASEIAGFSKRLRIDLSQNGFLRLIERQYSICVESTDVDIERAEVTVAGAYEADTAAIIRLYFESSARVLQPIRVRFDEKNLRFSATFSLRTSSWDKTGASIAEGGYALKSVLVSSRLGQAPYWVPLHPSVHAQYPKHDVVPSVARVRVARTKRAVAVWMNVYAPFDGHSLGKFAQRRLVRNYQAIATSANVQLEDATLFESFGGASITDSPKALFEYAKSANIGGKLYWTVRDGSVVAPPGSEAVIIHSERYHELLATARYLVNNNNFPYYYRKPEGQFYLQTWHGTPLKKIGYDVPKANLSISYRRLMSRESAYWDALIAQNDYAVPHFKRAFGFEGPVWTEGYPRNDSLVDGGATNRALFVREKFGFAADAHVVLYAPTWRDNAKTATNDYALVSHLDFDKIHEKFGDKVKILFRGHANTAKASRNFTAPNVVDVSTYSDVNDLILASDMLITDYSSIMFDYVATNKPVVILAPDISEYGSETRGFYYDFESDLPGPLMSTTDEVVSFLDGDIGEFTDRGRHYSNRFGILDDGLAASRIGNLLWAQSNV